MIIIDCETLAKQGDSVLGSVRPSVPLSLCPSVCLLVSALTAEKTISLLA